jgi:hypothetical protein
MVAIPVPVPDFKIAIVEPGTGVLTRYGYALVSALFNRVGGQSDKVDAAHALALAAVPQGTEVVAGGGLKQGGMLGGNVAVVFYVARAAAASLPTTAMDEGDWAYALDGRKPGEGAGSGTGVPCFWSAGAWISACDGAVVTV